MPNKKRISDNQGKIIKPGTWSDEEVETEADRILEGARVSDKNRSIDKPFLHKPYSSESLIRQFRFFANDVHKPNRIFYPCCGLDISPLKGFPDSEVVLMDNDEFIKRTFDEAGITQFIQGNATNYKPKSPFDLVIVLNPQLPSRDLTKHLNLGGYVLANNWHNNASELLEDKSFEGIGTIDRNKGRFYLARKNFSRIEPNQFATFLYAFRRIK